MHRSYRILLAFANIALTACGPEVPACQRFFAPYPDLNPSRARTVRNGDLVDAMALYARNDHAAAAKVLERYLAGDPESESTGHFYLANCYLALGRPYDAERELDFVERDRLRPFQDEVDWYNLLCMVCSGQHERALERARSIAAQARHAYRTKAVNVIDALGG